MKIAFSTLGCPDWEWNDIFATAKDLGFNGIEVRGVANELFVPHAKPFLPDQIAATKERLQKAGITIPMLTSGIAVGIEGRECVTQAYAYVDLAQKLGCPFIRIMISSHPQPEQVNFDLAVLDYNEICCYAQEKGVTPLIETNGILADTQVMNDFMMGVDSPNKGVLWDVHHPYRFFGETPQMTYDNIGKYIRYVHVKDSVIDGDVITYRMMGYGDVPVFDALAILKANQNDSFVSLEWVKRWNPELEGAGIVFAHFINYIKYLETQI